MNKNKKNIKSKQKSFEFFKFLISKEQLPDWILMFVVCLAGYIILKICYPFPNCISDSLGYIYAAEKSQFYFYRPYGFSYFLELVHAISPSVHAVFISQMIIYFISTVIFAFTIKYFFKPRNKIVWYVLLFVFTLSPMGFRLANNILSDLIYGATIYIMIAAFIFIVKKRSWFALIALTIFLFFSLHIRYSSIIFPIVFIALLFMVKGIKKWIGIVAMVFVTFVFYNQVKSWMKSTTKINQYSTGFDGWQMANNALHIIPFTDIDANSFKNPEVKKLHEFVITQKDSISFITKNGTYATAGFLWSKTMPLKLYLAKQIKEKSSTYTRTWIKLGSTTYSEYGRTLIMKHPIQFFKYYFMPNSKGIVYPERTEVISHEEPIKSAKNTAYYNIPEDTDTSNKHEIYKNFLAKTDQIIWAVQWIFILGISILGIIYRKKMDFSKEDKKVFWGIFAFAVIYYGSIVFASPIAFRYWFAIRCVNFACFYILLNKLIELKQKKKLISQNGQ